MQDTINIILLYTKPYVSLSVKLKRPKNRSANDHLALSKMTLKWVSISVREDTMNYRKLAIATAFLISSVGVNISHAETLKVSTFVPPNHAFNRMLTAWGKELSEKSGGALDLEIFPSGQLGPPPRQFDLVTSGAADIALILHAATPGRFPLTEMAGLPLTTPSVGIDSASTSKRLTEIAPEYLAGEHSGTKILMMAVTPALKIHLKDTNPSSIEAFKGKRFRYAGSTWQKIFESLGAAPTAVPPAATTDAISKGVVDGASFPFEATKSFDMASVLKYSLEPGLASATFAVVMSEDKYNSLSAEMQKLIDDTTGSERAAAFGKSWDEGESEARQYLIDGGVQIVSLPTEEQAKLEALLAPIKSDSIASAKAANLPADEFLNAYTK